MNEPALEFDAGITLGRSAIDARFHIDPGTVTAIFGPSGAGKSTLLSLVAGALQPDRGHIAIDGRIVADATRRHATPMQRRDIGWVFQDGKLFPHLTVRDNLLFGARLRAAPRGSTSLQLQRVVDVLGLGALLQRHPRDLSGGERQRTAIGRALLSQPKLLLLDEPLASLDAPRRKEILTLLLRVREELRLPMLYVTHSLGEVLRVADRLLILDAGRMLAEGPLTEMIGRADTPLLAQRHDVGAIIEAPLAGTAQRGLTRLDLGDGLQLTVPADAQQSGPLARVYVLANEVMLAMTAPQAISVRNVLPATVTRIVERSADAPLIELQVGAHRLLAAVTRDAVAELGLRPGVRSYALVKSVAIDAPAGARLVEAG